MRKPEAKRIEQLKSILLVVLFLMTVLLLYFFWESASPNPFRFTEMIHPTGEMTEVPQLEDTVIPTGITVSFGDGTYTVILDGEKNFWERALQDLKEFGKNSSVLVREIPKETYMEAVAFPSIQFQFHYDIPFDEFCEFYHLKKGQGYEIISGMATLAYSTLSKESILIYQQKDDKYYAIVADKDYTNFSTMLEEVEKGGYPSYYPATTFFGEGVQSQALLPLSLQSELLAVNYEKEPVNAEDEKVKELAESFFGESFDFIRRFIDIKGDTTYMYGYGQKIFVIHADGTFEYKEQVVESMGASPKFFESLGIALNFVAIHGSWNSLDGEETSAYLKKVTSIGEEKNKGYRFNFGMKLGTQNVYYEEGAPIIVDVINGQVTGYKRNMIDFEKGALNDYLSGEPRDTFDPVNAITTNYKYIYQVLKEEGFVLPPISQPDSFDNVVSHISSMDIGYVRPKTEDEDGEQLLIPCYRITFGKKVTLYFDLFNEAEPIGRELEFTAGNAASKGE